MKHPKYNPKLLYTPLDVLPVPEFDINKLIEWCKTNTPNTDKIGERRDAKDTHGDRYPWNIVYPRKNFQWQYGFDTEFPQLVEWYGTAYGIEIEKCHDIVLLPIKSTFSGVGFWHSDPDEHGIRAYLENEEPDEFLHIRPTAQLHLERPPEISKSTVDNEFDIELQPAISAKLLSRQQAFYINNTTAVHAVVTPQAGRLRVATIVSFKLGKNDGRLEGLKNRSAKKFSDHVIFWNTK
jgi:hypothetical protein